MNLLCGELHKIMIIQGRVEDLFLGWSLVLMVARFYFADLANSLYLETGPKIYEVRNFSFTPNNDQILVAYTKTSCPNS